MENALDAEVKAILESRRGDWQAIATKAQVSHSWLSKFVNGHIPNPGYATLKRLHECLTAVSDEPAVKGTTTTPDLTHGTANGKPHKAAKKKRRDGPSRDRRDKPSNRKGRPGPS